MDSNDTWRFPAIHGVSRGPGHYYFRSVMYFAGGSDPYRIVVQFYMRNGREVNYTHCQPKLELEKHTTDPRFPIINEGKNWVVVLKFCSNCGTKELYSRVLGITDESKNPGAPWYECDWFTWCEKFWFRLETHYNHQRWSFRKDRLK